MRRKISIEGKRPAGATPEKALEMSQSGKTFEEIGQKWGITRQRVGQLIKIAREKV